MPATNPAERLSLMHPVMLQYLFGFALCYLAPRLFPWRLYAIIARRPTRTDRSFIETNHLFVNVAQKPIRQFRVIIQIELLIPRVGVQIHRRTNDHTPNIIGQNRKFRMGSRRSNARFPKPRKQCGAVFRLSLRKTPIREQRKLFNHAVIQQPGRSLNISNSGGPSRNANAGRPNLLQHRRNQIQQRKLPHGQPCNSRSCSQHANTLRS